MHTRVSVAGKEIGVFNDVEVGMGLAMRLEDETGWSLPELLEQVGRGSARGLQAFIWFTQVVNNVPNPNRYMEFTFQDIKLESLDEAKEAPVGKGSTPVKAVKAA